LVKEAHMQILHIYKEQRREEEEEKEE